MAHLVVCGCVRWRVTGKVAVNALLGHLLWAWGGNVGHNSQAIGNVHACKQG